MENDARCNPSAGAEEAAAPRSSGIGLKDDGGSECIDVLWKMVKEEGEMMANFDASDLADNEQETLCSIANCADEEIDIAVANDQLWSSIPLSDEESNLSEDLKINTGQEDQRLDVLCEMMNEDKEAASTSGQVNDNGQEEESQQDDSLAILCKMVNENTQDGNNIGVDEEGGDLDDL